MKITLSKSQWECIGKTAGWMSQKVAQVAQDVSRKVCPQCKGEKFITEKIKNLGTLDFRDSFEPCSMCSAKGYITQEDHDRISHNMGVAPCPHCKNV